MPTEMALTMYYLMASEDKASVAIEVMDSSTILVLDFHKVAKVVIMSHFGQNDLGGQNGLRSRSNFFPGILRYRQMCLPSFIKIG